MYRFKEVTGTPFHVVCVGCGNKGIAPDNRQLFNGSLDKSRIRKWFADLNGEPFKDYYCDSCIYVITKEDN